MELLKEYLDYGIFGTLGCMSFLMVFFSIERYIYYLTVKLETFTHIEELKISLTNNLTAIAIIGANAPYVGLLGTVLGILITFYDLSQANNIDASNIMLGLALALKATAAGLVVAIPSIIFYNGLLRKVEVLTAKWQYEKI